MVAVKIETLEQNPVGMYIYSKMGFQEVARQIHYLKLLDGSVEDRSGKKN